VSPEDFCRNAERDRAAVRLSRGEPVGDGADDDAGADRKIAASSGPRWFCRPSNPVLTASPHQARTVPDGPVPVPAQTPSTLSTLAAVEEAKWETPTGVVGCGVAVQQRQDHRLPVADHADTAFL
jgi:hypothetical protein